MSIYVTDTAGLVAALGSAAAGETIQLAQGDYSLVNANARTVGVTVTSADQAHPASLTNVYLTGAANITFQNIDVKLNANQLYYPIRFEDAQNITFNNVHFHGDFNAPLGPEQSGVYFGNSNNIAITNSEFDHLARGLVVGTTTGVYIAGNYFHDIKSDGINSAGSSNVTIYSNYFTDFHPTAADHPDAIQIFSAGQTRAAHDITIQSNLIYRGAGGIMQGIFIQDETGHLRYTNINITGNTVIGGMYNSISVSDAANVQITDNRVGSLPDQLAWIRADNVTGAVVAHNAASSFTGANVGGLDNNVLARVTDNGQALLQSWHDDTAAYPAYLPGAVQMLAGLAPPAPPPAPVIDTPPEMHVDQTMSMMGYSYSIYDSMDWY